MSSNFDFYMAADLSGHIGEWIAICNDKVVAKGDDAKTVLNEAKSLCGRKRVLLTKVPDEKTLIF